MSRNRLAFLFGVLCITAVALFPSAARAFDVKPSDSPLESKSFFKQDLYISSSNVPASSALEGLANRTAWNRFFETYGQDVQVWFDPRSGTPSGIIASIPMIPGTGTGNRVQLQEVGQSLGRKVEKVDGKVVADLVRAFLVRNQEALGIDTTQLAAARTDRITPDLWQVSIPQEVDGIPVRYGRVAATISHGNLILLGTEVWGNVKADTKPGITGDQAVSRGFEFAGGKARGDAFWKKPTLELVPFAPQQFQSGEAFAGPIGAGYGHRLVWSYGFRREGEDPTWEVLVDAHTGEMLAFEDRNAYETRKISGGVYPLTSTEICPSNATCGTMQPNSPMPFADTGLPAPNDFTNSAGLFEYPGAGNVTTTFSGKYVKISDTCGTVSETRAGDVALGGTNGQHDCVTPPGSTSAGNTPASRSAFYEVNKLVEMARGWLPGNAWLQAQLPTNVNINQTCNAFWNGTSINFYRSGGGCRNTGEIAAVFDHEWGHGLDDNDVAGSLSNSSEAYADVASMYRLQASCIGFGFLATSDQGCGQTADGTGYNYNESQTGTHCILNCSGVRDADWAMHADGLPDTPLGYVCTHCSSSSGPCGRQVHCSAAPSRQAAWDLAARDLQAAPFNLSQNDAFIVASKIFFQGSGNIGAWHACTCGSSADGCGATNAYLQWLGADDDNGNLSDGTPHMTAIYAAFNRHGIACNTPTPQNGGCASGPTTAPTVSASIGSNQLTVSWAPVAGASTYRILRSEGYAGCDFGKAVLAEVPGTSYTDSNVANGRDYSYVVQAVGSSGACFGPSSACVTATPQPCAGAVSVTRSVYNCADSVSINLVDADLTGSGSHAVAISSGAEATPEVVVLTETPAASGRFSGSIATTSAPAANGDGQLSVFDGDTITVSYLDVSYCGTPNVGVTRSAPVDCSGPTITNVRAENVTGNRADIKWDTNEGADSQVTFGLSVPPGSTTPVVPDIVTSHSVRVQGLQQCSPYYFAVGSKDPAANAAFDSNSGSYYTFTTGTNTTPTWSFTGSPVPIPDNTPSGASATIAVTDVNDIVDLNVKAKITHTFDGDIVISLVAPDGTTVLLSNRRGSSGENFDNTIFDDQAATPISAGAAPFAGSFQPEQPLSVLNGKFATGTWTLLVVDQAGIDVGTIDAFELQFEYPSIPCGQPQLRRSSYSVGEACNGTGAGGGNTIVDPGEDLTIPYQVVNTGAASATNVQAVLSTTTLGVTVTTGTTSFGTVPIGGFVSAGAPFVVRVGDAVPCGTVVSFQVAITSNEGSWTDAFSVRVGQPVFIPSNYASTDTPKPIADVRTPPTTSTIVVADPGIVGDVNVTIDLTHTWDSDLDLFLIGPNGTRVELSTDNGSSSDNYTNTVFDDEAATAITAGTAPFTGSFRPEGSLATLDGIPAAGSWTLEITDDTGGDSGQLLGWSILITTPGGYACNACAAPPLAPGEVPSLSWIGASRDRLDWTAASNATTYYLYRGADFELPKLLDASNDSCERVSSAGLSSGSVLAESPASDTFYWYLVRANNAAGFGPAGNATAGARIVNDTGVCP